MNSLTPEQVKSIENIFEVFPIYEGIQKVEKLMNDVTTLQRPKKPILVKNHTAKDVEQYSMDFALYEADMVAFEKQRKIDRDIQTKISELIVFKIKKEAGLFDIPAQYQDKVYQKAWEDGHSYGYYEVYNQLCMLVEIFK